MAVYDYTSVRLKALEAARSEFGALPANDSVVDALAEWTSWVRDTVDAVDDGRANHIRTLIQSEADNPSIWCARRGWPLPLAITVGFAAQREQPPGTLNLPPLLSYLLGRAGMASALKKPEGTGGLTLPYRLVEAFNGFGISKAGADDQLFDSAPQSEAVIEEIQREIAHLSSNPVGTVPTYDRRSLEAVTVQWQEAICPEQIVGWHMTEVLFDLKIGNVLRALARPMPDFVAEQLDKLGHPALISAVLTNREDVTFDIILELLGKAGRTFDDQCQWTRLCAARLLLNAFEVRCLAMAQTKRRKAGEQRATDVQNGAGYNRHLTGLAAVLLKRHDGRPLAIEWINHLLNMLTASESRGPSPEIEGRTNDIRMLLKATLDQMSSQQWAVPRKIWEIFGGASETFPKVSSMPNSKVSPPIWLDGHGQQDRVTPLAVAISLVSNHSDAEVDIADLLAWLMVVMSRLEQEPRLHWLSRYQTGTLLYTLAQPLASASDPSACVQQIWDDSSWVRLKARFYQFQRNTKPIDSCAAIVSLGIHVLRLVPARLDATVVAPVLAGYVATMIDELRYGIVEDVPNRWSSFVGMLSGTIAKLGRLSDMQSCMNFLSRFVGDDDCLAAAVVNAATNGAEIKLLAEALQASGVEPRDLRHRWINWNARLISGEQSDSLFVAKLTEIANAVTSK